MELTAYLRVIRRRWRLIAAMGILGLLVGVASYILQPKQNTAAAGGGYFKATHTLLGAKEVNLTQVAAIATTGEVPRRVADRIGGSPGALSSSTAATPVAQANLLQITNFSNDPARAAQTADAFAEELVRYQVEVQDRQRQASIDSFEQQRESLRAAYDEVLRKGADETDPDKQNEYMRVKDDLVNRGKEIEAQIEALKNQAPTSGSLTSLSTAEPQSTTAEAMAKALSSNPQGDNKSNTTVDAASVESQLRSSRPLGLVPQGAIGAAVGLLLGIGLTILIERLDPRIRTKEQAELAYGWPVIAEMPPLTRKQQKLAEVLIFTEPRSRTAEAFRVLRSAILFASEQGAEPVDHDPRSDDEKRPRANGSGAEPRGGKGNGAAAEPEADSDGKDRDSTDGDNLSSGEDDRARVVLVTSPGPSEGKTTTASNLAGAIAETGFRVLIINCDFRRPRLAEFFGRDSDAIEIVSTPVPGVDILNECIANADALNPAVVLAAQRRAIHDHVGSYDVIILDTAPLLTTNDAVDVLTEADAVVVVGRCGKTTRESADRAAEALERRNAPVIGVVLVAASDSPSGRYYYYDTQGYYVSRSGRGRDRAKRSAGELAEADTTPP